MSQPDPGKSDNWWACVFYPHNKSPFDIYTALFTFKSASDDVIESGSVSAGRLNGEEIDVTGSGYAARVARSQRGIKLPFDPSER